MNKLNKKGNVHILLCIINACVVFVSKEASARLASKLINLNSHLGNYLKDVVREGY